MYLLLFGGDLNVVTQIVGSQISLLSSSELLSERNFSIGFLGGGSIVSRLPEIFKRPGIQITVFGTTDNPLSTSQFVDTYVELEQLGNETWAQTIIRHVDAILQQQCNWYIVENDIVASELARSDLNTRQKLALLPTLHESGLAILGSKVGLATAVSQLQLSFPTTSIAYNVDDLIRISETWSGSSFIKSDQGGGGRWIRFVETLCSSVAEEIPASWFPVLVQERIVGEEISVEVLFREGKIAGWLYSQPLSSAQHYGPSVRRRYLPPHKTDFEDTLALLAHNFMLEGLFNCSFIWSNKLQKHILFEADPRPNPWHQFGPLLGVDWVSSMTAPGPFSISRPHLSRPRKLGLYPRAFVYFGLEKKLSLIIPWLLMLPGTWNTWNRKDRAINMVEDQLVISSLGIRSRIVSLQNSSLVQLLRRIFR